MTRIRRQPVRVEHRDGTPVAFGWGGRELVVQEVLDHWTETGPWWRSPQVVALTSGEPTRSSVPVPAGGGPGSWVSGEQDWWRVEAGSGRHAALSGGPGVYDLCHEVASGSWTLVRVMD
jgi:hypothetical protein